MGRGTGWVLWGAFLILFSLCGGGMVGRLAAEVAAKAASERRTPDEVAVPVNTLGCFGLALNGVFYAGLVCISVGVTLGVLDGDQPARGPSTYNLPPPPRSGAGGDEGPPRGGDPPPLALFGEALRQRADRDRGAEPPPPTPAPET